MTIASSGEGATLDGQGGTGLFHLEGGCSLTLRRLNLVNGRAVSGGVVSKGDGSTSANGGVVHANGAGDVEIIGSTVTGCSADSVRRVELATALQRRTGMGREIKRATLSPRNRRPAASSTRMTAVRSRSSARP